MSWHLHRRVSLASLDADLLDPAQTLPTVVANVRVTHDQAILWVAIPYDGVDPAVSVPVAPAGLTVDGALVIPGNGLPARVRYPLLSEGAGQAPAGVVVEERPLPQSVDAIVTVPAVTNPGGVSAVWIYWTSVPRGSV